MQNDDRFCCAIVNLKDGLAERFQSDRFAIDYVLRVWRNSYAHHVAFGTFFEYGATARRGRNPEIAKRNFIGSGDSREFRRGRKAGY